MRQLEPLPRRVRGTGAIRTAALTLVGICLSGLTRPAPAVVLNGGLRTAVYVQESKAGAGFVPYKTDLENRVRLLETVQLDALQLGLPQLSFHTSFTGTNVLTDQSAKDTRFRLYRGYLQGAGQANGVRYDAKLGRHWVLAGVGTSVMDGVSLALSRPKLGGLDGFFGTLGSDRLTLTDRFWSLDKPSESQTFGGRARLHPVLGSLDPSLAVSYAQASRTPFPLGGSAITGVRVVDAERLGVHAELRAAPGASGSVLLSGLRAWGDWRRDMIYGRTLGLAGGLEFSGGPRDLRCWAEYDSRRPALRASSFFAAFESKPVNQLRGGAGMQVHKGIRLDVDGDLISFDGSESEKGVQLQVSGYGLSVGYRVHGGYGGDLSGLVLYGHRDLGEKLALDASVNRTLYKYGEATTDNPAVREVSENETTGILALAYRLLPRLTLTGQIEGMNNADFKRDVRFLGIVNWRFRKAL